MSQTNVFQGGKICTKCGRFKAFIYFSEDGYGGYRNDCKECASLQQHMIRENMEHHSVEYKHCSRCKRILPADAFAKDKTKVSGLRSHCRECDELARKHRNRNRLLKNPASKLY